MSKKKEQDEKINIDSNWYDLWTQQSKSFFESAEKNLKGVFDQGGTVKPEDHMQQINSWLDSLKNQWQGHGMMDQQKVYEHYGRMMNKMCTDATDMMMQQWMQRSHQSNPVQNVRELYELWLNCCNEVYSKGMHSKEFQDAYGDLMNATINFWKSMMQK
jgi:hypothetical protein